MYSLFSWENFVRAKLYILRILTYYTIEIMGLQTRIHIRYSFYFIEGLRLLHSTDKNSFNKWLLKFVLKLFSVFALTVWQNSTSNFQIDSDQQTTFWVAIHWNTCKTISPRIMNNKKIFGKLLLIFRLKKSCHICINYMISYRIKSSLFSLYACNKLEKWNILYLVSK